MSPHEIVTSWASADRPGFLDACVKRMRSAAQRLFTVKGEAAGIEPAPCSRHETVYIERKAGGPRRLLRILGRRQEGRFFVLELAPQRRRCQQVECLRL